MQEGNWLEAARRLFCLASAGELIRSSRGSSMSGGLDIALGDYVGHSPIGVLGPSIVLQGLLAGTIPETPFATSASLPMVRSSQLMFCSHVSILQLALPLQAADQEAYTITLDLLELIQSIEEDE